jgi:hypothetical protein
MEDPMTRFIATAALTALLLGAALPQAALAAHNDGIWKVDAAKSSFNSGSATLSMERVGEANPGSGAFIVVSKGNVYLVTGATAYDSRGIRQVDYARMATQGKAVLLGRNAQSRDICSFRCQGGLPEPRITLSFRPVSGADQHLNDMLAERN